MASPLPPGAREKLDSASRGAPGGDVGPIARRAGEPGEGGDDGRQPAADNSPLGTLPGFGSSGSTERLGKPTAPLAGSPAGGNKWYDRILNWAERVVAGVADANPFGDARLILPSLDSTGRGAGADVSSMWSRLYSGVAQTLSQLLQGVAAFLLAIAAVLRGAITVIRTPARIIHGIKNIRQWRRRRSAFKEVKKRSKEQDRISKQQVGKYFDLRELAAKKEALDANKRLPQLRKQRNRAQQRKENGEDIVNTLNNSISAHEGRKKKLESKIKKSDGGDAKKISNLKEHKRKIEGKIKRIKDYRNTIIKHQIRVARLENAEKKASKDGATKEVLQRLKIKREKAERKLESVLPVGKLEKKIQRAQKEANLVEHETRNRAQHFDPKVAHIDPGAAVVEVNAAHAQQAARVAQVAAWHAKRDPNKDGQDVKEIFEATEQRFDIGAQAAFDQGAVKAHQSNRRLPVGSDDVRQAIVAEARHRLGVNDTQAKALAERVEKEFPKQLQQAYARGQQVQEVFQNQNQPGLAEAVLQDRAKRAKSVTPPAASSLSDVPHSSSVKGKPPPTHGRTPDSTHLTHLPAPTPGWKGSHGARPSSYLKGRRGTPRTGRAPT